MTDLTTALERAYAAHAAYQALPGNLRHPEKAAAWNRHLAAGKAVSRALAAERGWRVCQGFTIPELREGRGIRSRGVWMSPIDHPEWYRDVDRRPVAIISHTYGQLPECLEFAQEQGLGCALLPYSSWYFPGRCLAVLFTRPDVSAKSVPAGTNTCSIRVPSGTGDALRGTRTGAQSGYPEPRHA